MPRRKGGMEVVRYDFKAVKDILVPYRRVSTREQADHGTSLAAQRTKIEFGLGFREQTALNWDCTDGGRSGENLDRPGIQKALSFVYAEQAGGIICSKLDRLTRNLLDFAVLMDKATKEGWNIVLLDIGVDLHTPIGKLLAGVLALFAQFERDVIIQRTNDGLEQRKAENVRLGRPRTISDDLLAAIIGAYYIEGSYSATARFLNAAGVATPQGGREWYPASIERIVKSQDGRTFLEMFKEAA